MSECLLSAWVLGEPCKPHFLGAQVSRGPALCISSLGQGRDCGLVGLPSTFLGLTHCCTGGGWGARSGCFIPCVSGPQELVAPVFAILLEYLTSPDSSPTVQAWGAGGGGYRRQRWGHLQVSWNKAFSGPELLLKVSFEGLHGVWYRAWPW